MTSPERIRILAVVDYYLPGFKGGGPTIAVSRLASTIGDSFDIAVFTRDRDLGDTRPYHGVAVDEWTKHDGVSVFYASPGLAGRRGLHSAVLSFRPDVLYLNSAFSRLTRAALMLKRNCLAHGVGYVIAPRGEFSAGALGQKGVKKSVYLKLANMLRLYQGVHWHVSSEREAGDLRAAIRCVDRVTVAVEIPGVLGPAPEKPPKAQGTARFCFLSRISPMKNLKGAIEMLADVSGDVSFTIYGPVEDEVYWAACESALKELPQDFSVVVAGAVPPEYVAERLAREHFFLLPTLGESFGYAIPEALGAGCPALISDRTPWQDLEEHFAGWATPLEDCGQWKQRLQACVDMEQDEYELWSSGARAYGERLVGSASTAVQKSRELFLSAVSAQ